MLNESVLEAVEMMVKHCWRSIFIGTHCMRPVVVFVAIRCCLVVLCDIFCNCTNCRRLIAGFYCNSMVKNTMATAIIWIFI